jgi:hypothetical protein
VSILSKIFVIVNMLLAVAFATFAITLYSKQVHYYEQQRKVEIERDEIKADLSKQITDLKGELATAIIDKKTANERRDQAIVDADKYANEKATAKAEALAATEKATTAVENMDALVKLNSNMRKELAEGRKVVVALKERETVLRTNTAELKKERDDLKNQVNRSRQDLAELHSDRTRIAEELANAEYVIATLIKKGYDVYKIVGPGALGNIPDVRTKVVDVRPATGHVALGVGKDSGIKEGFIFLIHRGDEYIGKVRVTTVWNNFSGGTIVERKKPMKAGDDAMTDTTPSP